MPIVFCYHGYKFFFYSNEGDPREPIHIHVRQGRSEAKFWLDPVYFASSDGFNATVLRELMQVVKDNSELIERAWHDYFA